MNFPGEDGGLLAIDVPIGALRGRTNIHLAALIDDGLDPCIVLGKIPRRRNHQLPVSRPCAFHGGVGEASDDRYALTGMPCLSRAKHMSRRVRRCPLVSATAVVDENRCALPRQCEVGVQPFNGLVVDRCRPLVVVDRGDLDPGAGAGLQPLPGLKVAGFY